MRIQVDLPETQMRELQALAGEQGQSRAELVRRAIQAFVAEQRTPLSQYFGLWAEDSPTEDAVEFQRRLRAEW